MMTLLKVFCIWISCIICLFGQLQLPIRTVDALEYYDDHEQMSYELDTEQSKAKYDSHLLAEQMTKDEPPNSWETSNNHNNMQMTKHTTNYHSDANGQAAGNDQGNANGNANANTSGKGNGNDNQENGKQHGNAKINEHDNGNGNAKGNGSGDGQGQGNDIWRAEAEEEKNLEPHERAASCHNAGTIYTHGQKVWRYDPCEVCICMDGEIFCWWEKCSKKPVPTTTEKAIAEAFEVDPYFPQNYATSTNRLKSLKKKIHKFAKNSKRKSRKQNNYSTTFQQEQQQKEQQQHQKEIPKDSKEVKVEEAQYSNKKPTPAETATFNYRYQPDNEEAGKENDHLNLDKYLNSQNYPLNEKVDSTQPLQHAKQHKKLLDSLAPKQKPHHDNEHHHRSTKGGNKILNFPENLPSVLYSDYKTEEHEHLQHQHHQQHLKHQMLRQLKKQQLQQHFSSNEESQQQQESKIKQQQLLFNGNDNRNEHDFALIDEILFKKPITTSAPNMATQKPGRVPAGASSSLSKESLISKSQVSGYYDEIEMESDILPVPPTKKSSSSPLATSPQPPTTSTGNESHPTAAVVTMKTQKADSSPTPQQQYQSPNINDEINSHSENVDKKLNELRLTTDYSQAGVLHHQAAHHRRHEEDTSAAVDVDLEMEVREEVEGTTDDAFHRWLTSNDTDNNKSQIYDEKYFDHINNKITPAALAATTTKATAAAATLASLSTSRTITAFDSTMETNGNGKVSGDGGEVDSLDGPGKPANPSSSSAQNRPRPLPTMTNVHPDTGLRINSTYSNSNTNAHMNRIIAESLKNSFARASDSNHSNAKINHLEDADQGGVAVLQSKMNELNNGSLINIDMSLVTSEEYKQERQQQYEQMQQQQRYEQQKLLQQMEEEEFKFQDEQFKLLPILSTGNKTRPGQNIADSSDFKVVATELGEATRTPTAAANGQSNKITSSTPKYAKEEAASSTARPQKHCDVLGTLYNIGDVLPQDTGNCLQCVCSESYVKDDTPRVTCSPHNCPPLVLPDLLDATGY